MTPKFRAWDTVRKKMWPAEEMAGDQMTLMPDGSGFINVSGVSTRLSEKFPHLIPLMSTGLKDMNVVEIYAKDIVQDSIGDLWLITTRDCKWVAIRLPWDKENEPPGKYDLCEMGELEVIGNVHDNPELLEDQK